MSVSFNMDIIAMISWFHCVVVCQLWEEIIWVDSSEMSFLSDGVLFMRDSFQEISTGQDITSLLRYKLGPSNGTMQYGYMFCCELNVRRFTFEIFYAFPDGKVFYCIFEQDEMDVIWHLREFSEPSYIELIECECDWTLIKCF